MKEITNQQHHRHSQYLAVLTWIFILGWPNLILKKELNTLRSICYIWHQAFLWLSVPQPTGKNSVFSLVNLKFTRSKVRSKLVRKLEYRTWFQIRLKNDQHVQWEALLHSTFFYTEILTVIFKFFYNSN